MSTLGFVLHPARAIPAQRDGDWLGRCCGFMNGTYMAWLTARKELAEQPERRWFDAPSLTNNAATYMEFNRPEHREQYRAYVQDKINEWVAQGRPDVVYQGGPADFEAWSGQSSRLSLADLLGYRGLTLVKPTRGLAGALHHDGRPYAFAMTPSDGVELAMVAELARAYGGENLAMWSYGRSLQLVFFRGDQQSWHRLRLDRPAQRPRRPEFLAGLREALAGSILNPDWSALEEALAAPEVSLTRWFAAFGLPGAMEVVPEEAPQLWEFLDNAGGRLLTGENPEAGQLKVLNKALAPLDGKLPGKPGKGMARKVSDAASALAQLVGWPSASPAWKRRHEVAEQYWSIVDGSALDTLTVGIDSKGVGASAALGRLQAHYQDAPLRDGIFWALAAHEAESANGHSYVQPLEVLAENAHTAGFTLVIYPALLQEKFRSQFGIGGGQKEAAGDWAGEVFLDLPGLLKNKVEDLAANWFAKTRADGFYLRAQADGSVVRQSFAKGKPEGGLTVVDDLGLREAARLFSPRSILKALGMDLLRTADHPLGAHGSTQGRASVRAVLDHYPPLESASAERWESEVPGPPGPTCLRLELPFEDERYGGALLQDLRHFFSLSWAEGRLLWAGRRDPVNLQCVAQILGDLPAGTKMLMKLGDSLRHLEL